MKKLLYIANLRLPTEKAYGIQIAKMCEAFAMQELNVTLVHPFRYNHIKNDIFSYYSLKKNFTVQKIWTPDFYFPGRLDKIAANIKGAISALFLFFYVIIQKADIIYSRDEWPLYFLSFFKKNLFFEAHRFSKYRKLFYRRFKNKNFKIIVLTKRLKEDFIKVGLKPGNILVVSDGVDLDEFNINLSREKARARIGLPINGKIVMYTGHLFEWKGAGVLLEAARNFQKIENVFFVFIGGMDYDVNKFKEKANGLENVLILGQRPHKEIPIYLKAADVLVLPNSAKEEISKFYTSPLKLFEYMASERSIVSSDLPSTREVLNDNNSILVKSDSAYDLAEGIKIILNKPDFGAYLAQKAIKDVQNYTWARRAEKVLNFIKPWILT